MGTVVPSKRPAACFLPLSPVPPPPSHLHGTGHLAGFQTLTPVLKLPLFLSGGAPGVKGASLATQFAQVLLSPGGTQGFSSLPAPLFRSLPSAGPGLVYPPTCRLPALLEPQRLPRRPLGKTGNNRPRAGRGVPCPGLELGAQASRTQTSRSPRHRGGQRGTKGAFALPHPPQRSEG